MSEEFATKVAELRKIHQQSVRDGKNELLPAVLKALSDEEAQAIVEKIEAEKAEIEEARQVEAEQRRIEARLEREQEARLLAEQQDEAEREQEARMAVRQTVDAVARTGEVAAESAKQMVRSTAEVAQRVATAPMSTGSVLWDSMFNLWTAPLGRAVARPTNGQPSSQEEEVIPLAEETLVVGKQTVTSGTTTVRRVVVETPVQQQVTLYDEKVIVERRKPVTDAVTGETLTEVTIEMIETTESARGWQEREGAGRGRRAPGTHPTDRDRAGHRPSGRDRGHALRRDPSFRQDATGNRLQPQVRSR